MTFSWNWHSKEVVAMKKTQTSVFSLKRLVILLNVDIEVYLRASSALHVNGVLMIAAFHVGSCITCPFVTPHNVLLLIRVIGCGRLLSVQRIRLQGQGVINLCVSQLFASLLRYASSAKKFLPSNTFIISIQLLTFWHIYLLEKRSILDWLKNLAYNNWKNNRCRNIEIYYSFHLNLLFFCHLILRMAKVKSRRSI